MFDLSPEKILVLGMLALIVLGPDRLPQAARTLGRLVAQARSMTSNLQSEVRDALHEPGDAFGAAIAEFRPSQVRRNVRRAVTDTLTGGPTSSSGAESTAASVPAAGLGAGPPPAADAPFVAPEALGGHAAAGPGWPYNPDDPTLN